MSEHKNQNGNNNGQNRGGNVAVADNNFRSKTDEDFMLDLGESDKKEKGNSEKKPKPKRITISLDAEVLSDLKLLEQIGAFESKEDFIAQAATEKRNEAMKKLQTAVGKL